MKCSAHLCCIIFGMALFAGMTPSMTAAAMVDHSQFGGLLGRYVHDGRVDYAGFQADAKELDAYLESLARVNPDRLDRNEQMAFYINLYNAWTIKLILSRYPDVTSIKDLGGFLQSPWKKKFVKLNGSLVTLDHIEDDILRPVFKDPRVHFAINCASISCPPLLNEPYTGAKLEQQLEQVTKAFINAPSRNYLEGHTLYVCRIFKWFAGDFNNDIVGFFKKYADGDFLKRLEKDGSKIQVEYLDYDWKLNKA
jgi:Protein of unknown function, DUF547